MSSIDWNVLKDLELKTNKDVIIRLINSFLDTTEKYKAIQNEYTEARKIAHQLKSSSAIVGALKLSQLALAVEKTTQISEHEWTDFSNELNTVVEEFKNRTIYL